MRRRKEHSGTRNRASPIARDVGSPIIQQTKPVDRPNAKLVSEKSIRYRLTVWPAVSIACDATEMRARAASLMMRSRKSVRLYRRKNSSTTIKRKSTSPESIGVNGFRLSPRLVCGIACTGRGLGGGFGPGALHLFLDFFDRALNALQSRRRVLLELGQLGRDVGRIIGDLVCDRGQFGGEEIADSANEGDRAQHHERGTGQPPDDFLDPLRDGAEDDRQHGGHRQRQQNIARKIKDRGTDDDREHRNGDSQQRLHFVFGVVLGVRRSAEIIDNGFVFAVGIQASRRRRCASRHPRPITTRVRDGI